jgi:hypothetical protein
MHLPLDPYLLLVIALQLITIASCIEESFARSTQLMIRHQLSGSRHPGSAHVLR